MTEFTVLANPRGKGRPRFTRQGHVYIDSETRAYERQIRHAFLAAGGVTVSGQPVAVIIRAFHRVPKSWTLARQRAALSGEMPAVCKPDADNIAKAVLDALNGLAWADDRQVVSLHITKGYGVTPRLEIAVVPEGGEERAQD